MIWGICTNFSTYARLNYGRVSKAFSFIFVLILLSALLHIGFLSIASWIAIEKIKPVYEALQAHYRVLKIEHGQLLADPETPPFIVKDEPVLYMDFNPKLDIENPYSSYMIVIRFLKNSLQVRVHQTTHELIYPPEFKIDLTQNFMVYYRNFIFYVFLPTAFLMMVFYYVLHCVFQVLLVTFLLKILNDLAKTQLDQSMLWSLAFYTYCPAIVLSLMVSLMTIMGWGPGFLPWWLYYVLHLSFAWGAFQVFKKKSDYFNSEADHPL